MCELMFILGSSFGAFFGLALGWVVFSPNKREKDAR